MSRKREWWQDFFPTFRPVFGRISAKSSNAQARYFIRKFGIKPGHRFLDCPCGVGRISLPIARQGIRVTGVDVTKSYLDELAMIAKRRGIKIDLVHSDMRRIKFDNRFHAAGNIWTSFGFFEKESDNLLVLKKMFRALKPGGRFVLHLINRDWILANYQPTGWFETRSGKVFEKRGFDYKTSKSTGTWTFIGNGEEVTHEVTIRMYSYHELVAMFEKVGFVDIEGFGGMKNEPISRDQRMMFVFGRKP